MTPEDLRTAYDLGRDDAGDAEDLIEDQDQQIKQLTDEVEQLRKTLRACRSASVDLLCALDNEKFDALEEPTP